MDVIKCGVLIAKPPFSWRSGKVIKGTVHNPHYYEWMRQTNDGQVPRQPGDNLGRCCDALPSFYDQIGPFLTEAEKYFKITDESLYVIGSKIHRLLTHITHEEIPRWNNREDEEQSFLALRVKYLLNDISAEQWKKVLQQKEKQREKRRDIFNILSMFIDTSNDIIRTMIFSEQYSKLLTASLQKTPGTRIDPVTGRRIHGRRKDVINVFFTNEWQKNNNIDTCEHILNHMKQLHKLRDYTNQCLEIISKRYSCIRLKISGNTKWKTENTRKIGGEIIPLYNNDDWIWISNYKNWMTAVGAGRSGGHGTLKRNEIKTRPGFPRWNILFHGEISIY